MEISPPVAIFTCMMDALSCGREHIARYGPGNNQGSRFNHRTPVACGFVDTTKEHRQDKPAALSTTEQNTEETHVKTHSPFRAGCASADSSTLRSVSSLCRVCSSSNRTSSSMSYKEALRRRAMGRTKPPMKYYWAVHGLYGRGA